MENSISQITLILSFVLFILLAGASFYILRKYNFFKWKINLIVFIIGSGITVGIIILLNKFATFDLMLIFAIILIAPHSMYHVIATRKFIERNKNITNVKTYQKK